MKTHKKGNQITLILLKLDQWYRRDLFLFHEVDLISKSFFQNSSFFSNISNSKFKRTVYHFQTKALLHESINYLIKRLYQMIVQAKSYHFGEKGYLERIGNEKTTNKI